jgi:hypothetical protein
MMRRQLWIFLRLRAYDPVNAGTFAAATHLVPDVPAPAGLQPRRSTNISGTHAADLCVRADDTRVRVTTLPL